MVGNVDYKRIKESTNVLQNCSEEKESIGTIYQDLITELNIESNKHDDYLRKCISQCDDLYNNHINACEKYDDLSKNAKEIADLWEDIDTKDINEISKGLSKVDKILGLTGASTLSKMFDSVKSADDIEFHTNAVEIDGFISNTGSISDYYPSTEYRSRLEWKNSLIEKYKKDGYSEKSAKELANLEMAETEVEATGAKKSSLALSAITTLKENYKPDGSEASNDKADTGTSDNANSGTSTNKVSSTSASTGSSNTNANTNTTNNNASSSSSNSNSNYQARVQETSKTTNNASSNNVSSSSDTSSSNDTSSVQQKVEETTNNTTNNENTTSDNSATNNTNNNSQSTNNTNTNTESNTTTEKPSNTTTNKTETPSSTGTNNSTTTSNNNSIKNNTPTTNTKPTNNSSSNTNTHSNAGSNYTSSGNANNNYYAPSNNNSGGGSNSGATSAATPSTSSGNTATTTPSAPESDTNIVDNSGENLDVISIDKEPSSEASTSSGGGGSVIPVVLGVGAAGAAAVGGIKYMKSRKEQQNSYDEESEDENDSSFSYLGNYDSNNLSAEDNSYEQTTEPQPSKYKAGNVNELILDDSDGKIHIDENLAPKNQNQELE